MKKRVLASLLSLAMVISLLPVSALAVGEATELLDLSTNSIRVGNGSYTVSSLATANTITIESGATCSLTISGLNITAADAPAIRVEAGATLHLTVEGENSLTGGPGYAGICVEPGYDGTTGAWEPAQCANLTISGSGTLNATGGEGTSTGPYGGGAGIGGNGQTEGGGVTDTVGGVDFGVIHVTNDFNGTIIATGGGSDVELLIPNDPAKPNNAYSAYFGSGAGIGSGGCNMNWKADGSGIGKYYWYETVGQITIENGTISATSHGSGAGIGGGSAGGDDTLASYITVDITGGMINAVGGICGAGIGGGDLCDGGKITISGGAVTAKGGFPDEPIGAAGIGGGGNASVSSVSITGGAVVTATASGGAAGIGGGTNTPYSVVHYGDTDGARDRVGKISISGENTSVTATGGSASGSSGQFGGAGIGAGYPTANNARSVAFDISITEGAAVKAYGGHHAQAVGYGYRPNIYTGYGIKLVLDDTVTLWAQNADYFQPALAAETQYDTAPITYASQETYLVRYTDADQSAAAATGSTATAHLNVPADEAESYGWSFEGDALTINGTEAVTGLTTGLAGNWATLYRKPTPQYTVTYYVDDVKYTEEKVRDGNLATKPSDPEKPGFVFEGWYTAATQGSPYDFMAPVIADTTLYAKWSIDTTKEYTVTFDMGTGNPGDNQTQSVQGGEKAQSFTPNWEDHVFVDWYADEAKTVSYDFSIPITQDVTIYAKWKQLKYTLRYGDGREHDGEWGYNYAEVGEKGYYVPSNPEPLPSEVRHFSESDVNNPSYPGVNTSGWYFLSWMRYAETDKDHIDRAKDVYIKNGDTFEKSTNWNDSTEKLYQYIAEGKTPGTDCGDIEYFAQWMLIQIDVDVDVDIKVNVSISGIGENGAPVAIDESQKGALAKNVNLATDVRDSNTEIKITVFVRNAGDADELDALTKYLEGQYSYGDNRLDYDIWVEKEIISGGNTETTTLKTLAESIEIVFSIPDQWQSGGTVSMFRAHTEGGATKVTELSDLDSNAATYTVKSDKFSTYTMIYLPTPPGGGGGGEGGVGGGGGNTTYYTLHYESNGGTEYSDERYAKDTLVQLDKVPVREGYRFTGWYADQSLTEKISSITMTSDKTVYALWSKSTVPDMLNGEDHFAYVIGSPDGTVRPNANISRAEVAAIFFRLLKLEVRDGSLTSFNTFTDVNDGMWCNKAVSTMAALNIIKGRSSELFDPNAPITRAEFAVICARFDTSMTAGKSSLTDISGHWAAAEIERAAALGWIMGNADGTFRPDNYITRAEAMTMINRVLCRIPENGGDLLPGMNVWPDNQPGTWYYLAVQEATNSHSFQYKDEVYEYWTGLTADPDWTRYQN